MNFVKYQGTGNDFILINGDTQQFDHTNYTLIKKLCNRRFGIGADGFIIVRHHPDCDFEMLYYNADGNPGSLCGNGSRCAVAFAHAEDFFNGTTCNFLAYDGPHEARIDPIKSLVELKMNDVDEVEAGQGMVVMDTGSPHYVTLVEDLSDLDIVEAGRAIRYSPRFSEKGINVNFVELLPHKTLKVATYERGVEDETFSCGTGVTACAIAYHVLSQNFSSGNHEIHIQTKGGKLRVRFDYHNEQYQNIWLIGPAIRVFFGEIELSFIDLES